MLTRLTTKPPRFRVKGKKPGTTFSFKLDQAAKVRLRITRTVRGHRSGRRCLPGIKRKAKACRAVRTITTLSRTVRPGTTTIAFRGKVKGRRLAKGRYTVTATATSGRLTSRAVTLTVTGI